MRRAVMKWIDPLRRVVRNGRPLGCALLFATAAVLSRARGQEGALASSPQILLQAAAASASAQTSSKKGCAAAWRETGIKSLLLIRHGRLLPDGLAAAELERLAAALLQPDPSNTSSEQELPATLPAADDLVFDGQRYTGGNLSYIDSMLGKSGRPIAFDRELPALLVPLTPEAEVALAEKRVTFQADAGTRQSREAADQTYGEGAAALMGADGQFLRAYSGRFDDLYFHLFQNGNGPSALAFCGLADGLAERVYQPVHGIGRRSAASPARFDLDDILSDGAKSAVLRHLRAASGPVAEPFQEFAFRVLPSVVTKARALPPGTRFTATHAEILRALRSRQHLYPTRVPPLYRSPDRFLGWTGSFFMPVANGPALPPGATDSWYPLPEQGGRAASDQAAEGASSALLFESSSTPDIVWEDPQLSNLLADPEAPGGPRQTPANRAGTPPSSNPRVASDPRRRAIHARLLAIVTPTAEEAREYFAAIATSDEKLRAIEQTRGRIRLLRQFVESARTASPDTAPAETNAPSFQHLQQTVKADLASFEQRESDLAARLQVALQERADLRSELESQLVRDRVRPLQTLGKEAGEAEPREAKTLAL